MVSFGNLDIAFDLGLPLTTVLLPSIVIEDGATRAMILAISSCLSHALLQVRKEPMAVDCKGNSLYMELKQRCILNL